MSLGLTMEEIQELIGQASENTPDVGPDGHEMGDPEYVTAYLLNILIPLIRFNNLRIEEQLAAIGIAIPSKEQILEALAAQKAKQEQLVHGGTDAQTSDVPSPDEPVE